MIKVLHISAECYPAAKTGGLGDVVGSLPKYMTAAGVLTAAIIPKYSTKWIKSQAWTTVFGGAVRVDGWFCPFEIQQHAGATLGFPFFVVSAPDLFDGRVEIYGHDDELERLLVFQQAVLKWLQSFSKEDCPKVLHVHDHHAGLVPFMIKSCPEFQSISHLPTVFTIHNGQYQGQFSWKNERKMPFYAADQRWQLEWSGAINPMASAVRAAWAVTTVSQSYLYELHESALGLEPLFRQEWQKEWGIVNGIDADVWDPATDAALENKFTGDIGAWKWANKKQLCETFSIADDRPLVAFIGRLVGEKGSDILPEAVRNYLRAGGKLSFLMLGSGEKSQESAFENLKREFAGAVNCYIGYNENLSHLIYAGADFLIMPSRVEPCGLNQLYSMRYGTIPIVRSIGGLKDTVRDLDESEGRGIRFDEFSVDACTNALHRAAHLWWNSPGSVDFIRGRIMALDFSWESTIERYFNIYERFAVIR